MSWRKTNISQRDKGLLACCQLCKAGLNMNNPPLPLPLFFFAFFCQYTFAWGMLCSGTTALLQWSRSNFGPWQLMVCLSSFPVL